MAPLARRGREDVAPVQDRKRLPEEAPLCFVPQSTAFDIRSAIDWPAQLHESASVNQDGRNPHIRLIAHAKVQSAREDENL